MRPASRRAFAWRTWALALVASKTILISESSSTAWMPATLARMPSERARASPSELGSMPASRTSSICPGCFSSLYIKSLPMLPEPIMATLTRLSGESCHSITFLRKEVETVQWDDLLADNHSRRRSVVSNGIRKFDLPLCDPAVNEFQCRADAACCCQDSSNGDAWPL